MLLAMLETIENSMLLATLETTAALLFNRVRAFACLQLL